MDHSEPFRHLCAFLREQGALAVIHEHAPVRTMAEAEAGLGFEPARIVKTIAFGLRGGGTVLAALRGTLRVDYARLARELGVCRRDMAALSPGEVLLRTGVEPGGVSPLPLPRTGGMLLLLDRDVLDMGPTLFCGSGRPDRTIELSPEELLRLTDMRAGTRAGARLADFSRQAGA